MWPIECIEHKRDGKKLSSREIERFIRDYTAGRVAEYQAAAWLMAVYLNDMDDAETTALTLAMAASGQELDLSAIPGIVVDKHSTGGIADTTTLIVAPLVAAAGVPVAKMSGRGLGFTGGTIDKLEAVPGFRTELSEAEFFHQVATIGLAVMGQSKDIAPADKLLYALRDATGTVESIPLIASSIMSKKIAAGAKAIILDVKYGRGAFMKTAADAARLAETMVRIGRLAGRRTEAVVTSMEAPLGTAIGNSLEIDEAVEALSGRGGKRLMAVVKALGTRMLLAAQCVSTEQEGQTLLAEMLRSGAGLCKFAEFIAAQGGTIDWLGQKELTRCHNTYTVYSDQDGFLQGVDGLSLGQLAMALGAGRAKKEDAIDLHVGLRLHKELGDTILKGEPLITLYGKDGTSLDEAARRGRRALSISAEAVSVPPVISRYISCGE